MLHSASAHSHCNTPNGLDYKLHDPQKFLSRHLEINEIIGQIR